MPVADEDPFGLDRWGRPVLLARYSHRRGLRGVFDSPEPQTVKVNCSDNGYP